VLQWERVKQKQTANKGKNMNMENVARVEDYPEPELPEGKEFARKPEGEMDDSYDEIRFAYESLRKQYEDEAIMKLAKGGRDFEDKEQLAEMRRDLYRAIEKFRGRKPDDPNQKLKRTLGGDYRSAKRAAS